jgi:hypothetical protein
MPSLLTEFAIRDFEAYSQKIHPGATLYVPPVGTRPIVDHELLQDIASASHLQKIVDLSTIHSSPKRETK